MKKLNVFFESHKVGELKRDEELIYSFVYDSTWLNHPKKFPLSLVMPLEEKEFGNKVTLSFFENLLPEGDVRETLSKARHINGDFEFLKEFGKDCAGAIIISNEDESPFIENNSEKTPINMKKVFKAIDQNHSVADVIAEMNPGYLSLAGAQDKFPAIYQDKKFYLPLNGNPTTHIVKVPIQRHNIKESVYNEYYCMELARAIGFTVPICQVVGDGTHPLFVIERYDRFVDEKDIIHRIHQQDFCQAQGFVSENKYESMGGPRIKNNYELILKNVYFRNRVENTYTFLDWICFNLLIGNNDSHSKNISFILKDEKIELAPMYDLISTIVYPKLKRTFAFMIGERNEFSKIGKNQFEMLDKELGLKVGTMAGRMQIVHDKVMKIKDIVAKRIVVDHKQVKIVQRIAEEIDGRAKSLKFQKAIL